MRNVGIKMVSGFVLTIFVFVAHADEIDVMKELYAGLVGTKARNEVDAVNTICRTKLLFHHNCDEMKIRDLRLFGGDVTYSPVKPAPIPITSVVQSYAYTNCSDERRRDQRTVSMTYTQGYSITTSSSLKTTEGITASLTLPVLPLTLGGNESRSVDFSKQQTWDYSNSVTETVPFDETIEPWTALIVIVRKDISNAYIDFKGSFMVDAAVVMEPCCGTTGGTAVLGKYNDFFPAPKKFDVAGQVWNAKAESINKSYKEIRLTKDSPQCQLQGPDGLTGSALASYQKIFKPMGTLRFSSLAAAPLILKTKPKDAVQAGKNEHAALAATAIAPTVITPPTQIVVPFIDGMTITTADVVGNIEVRAMSHGPGFCNVTFSAGAGQSANFLAPPITYSPWTTLTSNFGANNFTLSSDVQCDTGVVAEVRYWK